MNEPATWQRPITIKRYLHPPKSERIFTLWTEGKVLFGEVNVHGFHVGDNYKVGRSYYFSLESCMAWLLDGEEGNQFDFRRQIKTAQVCHDAFTAGRDRFGHSCPNFFTVKVVTG